MLPSLNLKKKLSNFPSFLSPRSSSPRQKEEKPEIISILFLGTNEEILQTLNQTFNINHEDRCLHTNNKICYEISVFANIEDSLFSARAAVNAATILGLCPKDKAEREKLEKFIIPIDEEIPQKPFFDLTTTSSHLLIKADVSTTKIFLLDTMPTKDSLEYYKNSIIICIFDGLASICHISSEMKSQSLEYKQTDYPAFSSRSIAVKTELSKNKTIDTKTTSLKEIGATHWKDNQDAQYLLKSLKEEIEKILLKTKVSTILNYCETLLPEKLCSTEDKDQSTPRGRGPK